MRVSHVLALFLCTISGAARAQPQPAPSPNLPTEKVTVTAPGLLPDAVLHDFIKSYTAASPASGKAARWRTGVCPIAAGLPPAASKLITDRIRQVAAQAGAPVGAESCKPNIDIVFTLDPQPLLDRVRAKTPLLLGYHEVAQEKDLATVIHPIQAWYTTQTVDLHGEPHVDDKLHNQGGFYTGSPFGPKYGTIYFPEGHVEHATGSHLGDSVSSELYRVIIVVDLPKLNGYTIGALADHVAMLSLAQTQAFGLCQPVASIANLVSIPCDAAVKSNEITGNDLAYLRGLYSVDPYGSLAQQRDGIASRMKKGPQQN
jgi:hypothetical protein